MLASHILSVRAGRTPPEGRHRLNADAGSVLDGGPDRDVANLDVVRLLDGEGNGPRYRGRIDADLRHPLLHLSANIRILNAVHELGSHEAAVIPPSLVTWTM